MGVILSFPFLFFSEIDAGAVSIFHLLWLKNRRENRCLKSS